MNILHYPGRELWPDLVKRPAVSRTGMIETIAPICTAVKARGDEALREYERIFSRTAVETVRVHEREIEAAEKALPRELQRSMEIAAANIRRFHEAQRRDALRVEPMPGIVLRTKSVPVEKVGLYIPGGGAPLFSTVLMLGIPARIAGCSTIVMCTPPSRNGEIHPAILHAARLAGVREIYKTGGAQAIAAMAYGTQSIPAVYKIFGPGNQYVTAAKQYVFLDGTAIDTVAGPSEVLVVADSSADPGVAAADCIAQAEHGPDSRAVVCTEDEATLHAVVRHIEEQVAVLPRASLARQSLAASYACCMRSKTEIVDFINTYAPEHVILLVRDAGGYADSISNAGAVFLGHNCPESAGDYASGANHTLPTNGWARSCGGITLDSFMKTVVFQEMSREGLRSIGETIVTMARAEGLEGHAVAVTKRLDRLEQGVPSHDHN